MCTFERRKYFVSAALVEDVRTQFVRTAHEEAIEILAYCFMPDHVHFLVAGTSDGSDLQRFVSIAKQRSAHVARQRIHGRLWQPGYFDRILRNDDDIVDVARYILANPVRAGLVESPLDYPFIGSSILSTHDLIESCQCNPAWRPMTKRKGGAGAP